MILRTDNTVNYFRTLPINRINYCYYAMLDLEIADMGLFHCDVFLSEPEDCYLSKSVNRLNMGYRRKYLNSCTMATGTSG